MPHQPAAAALPDLEPAKWIWYPCERCLPNTFVLFRRTVEITAPLRRATGWIAADSRYRLEVNGRRIQWGPAPADPRWAEADPLDLTAQLQPGTNVLAVTVLYYGHGEGTWPLGKPGFLCRLEVEDADGTVQTICSDATWQAHLCRAWTPGHYKRWYLRALQEEFDANLYPYGWSEPAFVPGPDWLPAMDLVGSPNQPSLNTRFLEYQWDIAGGGPADAQLRARSIPLLHEAMVGISKLSDSRWLEWLRPVREYFESRTPHAYRTLTEAGPVATPVTLDGAEAWEVELPPGRGALLTFELLEQVVGWPGFTIEAPAGTVVELLVHEAHGPAGPPVLNTHFDSWTRFTCRAGTNHFETFDFESLRWLQLHLHGSSGRIRLSRLGVRRRIFPWPQTPRVRIGEPALQRLMDAAINTLHNCAQETLVDGMARERQQYSGDGSHQTHAIYLAMGETRLPARFLTTFSQGQTKEGYFLDCWPGFDRLARLVERQFDLTSWGPILDHGVGFNFDCWHHYLYTGDLAALREPYSRLRRFVDYLPGLLDGHGLLAVENTGLPSVWLDHIAYQQQRHKQCAFNLYAAAMLEQAHAPLCAAMGDRDRAAAASKFGRTLRRKAVARFWDPERALFVNNRPWLAEEKSARCCDRSLATAVLFDQCPGGRTKATLQMLADCPPEMGLSYPANAGWRLWALAKGGRADVIAHDLRHRWAVMNSVIENNTLQEDWAARPDSSQQWSHCAVVPLFIVYHAFAGLRPVAPGFARAEIRPQLADLASLDLTAHTVHGPIHFQAQGCQGDRQVTLEIPPGCSAELLLPRGERVDLAPAPGEVPAGLRRYALPSGRPIRLHLRQV
ncbi:MAG: alpha-L-rhamnosidase N-terminal domain-containing protein [Lacunisphaera sp.]|nr:alpha-L-rhamnosidase N-terminal domain-containing protein [Lacunisphaera sp.]